MKRLLIILLLLPLWSYSQTIIQSVDFFAIQDTTKKHSTYIGSYTNHNQNFWLYGANTFMGGMSLDPTNKFGYIQLTGDNSKFSQATIGAVNFNNNNSAGVVCQLDSLNTDNRIEIRSDNNVQKSILVISNKDNATTFEDTRVNKSGIEYKNDGYVTKPSSLVDKRYVDNRSQFIELAVEPAGKPDGFVYVNSSTGLVRIKIGGFFRTIHLD